MKFETLIHQHPCFFGDLKVAASLLEKRRPVVAAALETYATALAEYDTENSPFGITMDELVERLRNAKPKWEPDWTITEEGDIEHANGYYVEAERLGENWLEHLSKKKWVDMNTFIPAYIEACRRAGVKTVKIAY